MTAKKSKRQEGSEQADESDMLDVRSAKVFVPSHRNSTANGTSQKEVLFFTSLELLSYCLFNKSIADYSR